MDFEDTPRETATEDPLDYKTANFLTSVRQSHDVSSLGPYKPQTEESEDDVPAAELVEETKRELSSQTARETMASRLIKKIHVSLPYLPLTTFAIDPTNSSKELRLSAKKKNKQLHDQIDAQNNADNSASKPRVPQKRKS
ncbi:hypothetical protein DSO57_1032632 [Entomophthora muscae]|uniref:Uncharacterized protein n=1 Tax=Entomophthora muscae TaxID=34485 RepID=A0ACC2T0B5_9FUNG|nr:hypothetical protein DSO57_1032632 [Entomophthora muscae]